MQHQDPREIEDLFLRNLLASCTTRFEDADLDDDMPIAYCTKTCQWLSAKQIRERENNADEIEAWNERK